MLLSKVVEKNMDTVDKLNNKWQKQKGYVWPTIKDTFLTLLFFIAFITLFFKSSLIVIPVGVDIDTFFVIIELIELLLLLLLLFYLRGLLLKARTSIRWFKLFVNFLRVLVLGILIYFTVNMYSGKTFLFSHKRMSILKVYSWRFSVVKDANNVSLRSTNNLPFIYICFKGGKTEYENKAINRYVYKKVISNEDNYKFELKGLSPIASFKGAPESMKYAYCLDARNVLGLKENIEFQNKSTLQFVVNNNLFSVGEIAVGASNRSGSGIKQISTSVNKVQLYYLFGWHMRKYLTPLNELILNIVKLLYISRLDIIIERLILPSEVDLMPYIEMNKKLRTSTSLLAIYQLNVQKENNNNANENNNSNFYLVCGDEYIGNMGRDAIRKCFLVEKLQRNLVWIKIVDSILLVIIFIYTVRFAYKIGNIIRGKGNRLKEVLVDFISCVIVLGLLGFIVGFLLFNIYPKFESKIIVGALSIIPIIPCLFRMLIPVEYQRKIVNYLKVSPKIAYEALKILSKRIYWNIRNLIYKAKEGINRINNN